MSSLIIIIIIIIIPFLYYDALIDGCGLLVMLHKSNIVEWQDMNEEVMNERIFIWLQRNASCIKMCHKNHTKSRAWTPASIRTRSFWNEKLVLGLQLRQGFRSSRVILSMWITQRYFILRVFLLIRYWGQEFFSWPKYPMILTVGNNVLCLPIFAYFPHNWANWISITDIITGQNEIRSF
jgi:hypothetical protein